MPYLTALAHDPILLTLCCSAGLTANVIGSALGIQPRLRVRLDRPEMDGQEGAAFGLPLPVSALLLSGFDFAAMSPRRFPPPWQVEQTPGGFKVRDVECHQRRSHQASENENKESPTNAGLSPNKSIIGIRNDRCRYFYQHLDPGRHR